MIIFNGPVRQKIGIHCGAGCLGPGFKANATIGRALRLIMLNVGGAWPGEVDKAPLGWPGKFTCVCMGENEEESPWEPLHVERGFKPTDSTVTVLPTSGMWPITETSPDPVQVLHHVTHGMAVSGHNAGTRAPEGFEQVLIMSTVIAGYVSKLQPNKLGLKRYIWENALVPLSFYPPYRHQGTREHMAKLGLKMVNDSVPICESPDNIIILCAGGNGGLQSCGLSTMLGRSVTKKIEGV